MTVDITVQVPDALARELQRVQDRLPEILERGLQDVLAEGSGRFEDENAIIAILASQPSPEDVLGIHPSPEFQARVSDLLDRSKQGELGRAEEAELERALILEHLVRLAKAHAHRRLANRG